MKRGRDCKKEAKNCVISSPSMALAKPKELHQTLPDSGGMDELLEVLGYKLSDTVNYNPSDLPGWVQSMLSELNTTGSDLSSSAYFDIHESSSTTTMIDLSNNTEVDEWWELSE
ncbi:hypothetical protein E3N88_28379 [Mikania micrantha]|uniref:Transcriptional factor DELLA N-terminal domain-containing protein n=1 Tax=Mikania micrantha TaxID=192012 RepID=A0A5N6MZK9_9ASTR|nr:hypothetical protein E3N88_28379 [Mikania micrantha]